MLTAAENKSPLYAIETAYPEYDWKLWLFPKVPHNFWIKLKNQRKYLEWLAEQLEIFEEKDWYKLNYDHFRQYMGQPLLHLYKGKLHKLLEYNFPDREWYPWLFSVCPRGYWEVPMNQRRYFDWLADQLGLERYEEWYNVTRRKINDMNGGGLVTQVYHGSPLHALETVYPEYTWAAWLFTHCPPGYWDRKENIKKYFEWLAPKLGIKAMEDWYFVSAQNIFAFGGGALMTKTRGLAALLESVFPEYPWNKHLFMRRTLAKSQAQLWKALLNLFPGTEMKFNYRHNNLRYEGGYKMELDVYIPAHSLAFEYQGKQHFEPSMNGSGEFAMTQLLDEQKKQACSEAGITLIYIPYWWTYDKDSLIATIHQYRPDIFKDPGRGSPIPLQKPVPNRKNRRKVLK